MCAVFSDLVAFSGNQGTSSACVVIGCRRIAMAHERHCIHCQVKWWAAPCSSCKRAVAYCLAHTMDARVHMSGSACRMEQERMQSLMDQLEAQIDASRREAGSLRREAARARQYEPQPQQHSPPPPPHPEPEFEQPRKAVSPHSREKIRIIPPCGF